MAMEIAHVFLRNAMERVGIAADGYRPDYSGRFMFGKTCPAVVAGGYSDICALLVALGQDAAEGELDLDPVRLARSTRWDELGTGIVAYWPELRVVQEEGEG